jgi:hypothetical protein
MLDDIRSAPVWTTLKFFARWMALAVSGWLAYALVRGLWAIIFLGAPLYDWHWYLCVIPLLTVLPVYLVWRLTDTRQKRRVRPNAFVIVTCLLLAAIGGYGGYGQVVYLDPNGSAPVPLSFWAFSDLRSMPDAILEDVHAADGSIFLVVGDSFDGERGRVLASAIRRLAQYGIEVYLATPAGNDFLSVPSHLAWMQSTQAAAEFTTRETLRNVRGVIGDAEPPFNAPLDVAGLDRASFDRAVTDLSELIGNFHLPRIRFRRFAAGAGPDFVQSLQFTLR